MSNIKTFKVLSLDGGGIKGYLAAKILTNIEQYLNNKDGKNISVGQRFDLIAGTSTGGIIALGLSIGLTAKEIQEFYEKKIPIIFKKRHFWDGLLTPKYSNDNLKQALFEIFKDQTLNDVLTKVCITSVSAQNGKPRFYKSGYFDRNRARLDETLVDIALATSAAPTYFTTYSPSQHSYALVDGGICANNPAMVALIEAMQLNNHSLDSIRMVSVGTGDNCGMPYDVSKLFNIGKFNWIAQFHSFFKLGSPLIELLLSSQSTLVHHQVNFMLQDKYLRINPVLPTIINLDDADKLDELKNLADLDKKSFESIEQLLGI